MKPSNPRSASDPRRNASGIKRLKKFLARNPGRRSKPEPEVAIDWQSILAGDFDHACPVAEFRKLSEQLRKDGKFAEADRICSRGTQLHPDNLWLSLIHAKIADSIDDPELKRKRWSRVIELGGDQAPIRAFKNLADCHLERGEFDEAEALVRKGMILFPEDSNLEERLGRIAHAAGFNAKAIELWKAFLLAHPDTDCAWIYRKIGEVWSSEGLMDRAMVALEEGLEKYPENERLKEERLNLMARIGTPLLKKLTADENSTAHLFQARVIPSGQGICTLPFALDEVTQHVPAMLDFAECIAPFRDCLRSGEVDVFTTWGTSRKPPQKLGIQLANAGSKPLLSLERGFIGSHVIDNVPPPLLSIIVCPGSNYFDATLPSALETRLNSKEYQIDEAERKRAADAIRDITSQRLAQDNHAPDGDLRQRFPADGRKRLLLVDQRVGDPLVEKALGCGATFGRMWEAALALPNHEIVVALISDPRNSLLQRSMPDPLPPHVTVVDSEVNSYCLLEVVDRVFVCSSLWGFEALMANKEVDCFGIPFYAGWGLTHDRVVVPRRKRRRSLDEIFHLFFIEHSRYFVPGSGVAEIEDLIKYLTETRHGDGSAKLQSSASHAVSTPPDKNSLGGEPLRILIILPSPRQGASGRYIQNLAWSLCRLGCEVSVLAEGKLPSTEAGVNWIPLAFEGMRLATSVRDEVIAFSPHIVYENGVRSRSQRATLEILALTDARLAMQSEDDDVQVYETHHGTAAAEILTLIDKPALSIGDIHRYLELIDLKHSLNVLFDPSFDRWVEPMTRALCYRLASLHTAIWKPFEARLAEEYGVPTLVVPPVASKADFERIPATAEERGRILTRHGIEADRVVIFIGGALYSYSDEYSIFLDALNRTARKTNKPLALIITSGRSALPIARMARERLSPAISFADIDLTDDDDYMEVFKACDIVCSPGLPDNFNRFRLPSRLIKAMAMAKPILTCQCGFGESLENGFNAYLMKGSDPEKWAESIVMCVDEEKPSRVGEQGRIFARQFFDSDQVAASLKEKFLAVMQSPRRSLRDGISQGTNRITPTQNMKFRAIPDAWPHDKHHSTLRDAVRRIAVESGRLGTVVHLGAGDCGEFWDYCRLGVRKILLVDALDEHVAKLQNLTDADGRIEVRQAVISGACGSQTASILSNARPDGNGSRQLTLLPTDGFVKTRPAFQVSQQDVITTTIAGICEGLDLSTADNLLVLELNGVEATALTATSAEWLRAFRWIALRASDPPLFDGGSTPAQIQPLMELAGFAQLATPPNFGETAALLLFERRESGGTHP